MLDDSEYAAKIADNANDPNRYAEPYRPQVHFTPIRGWMNDPNGLVYFNGEWHLFYQYCDPAGADMHWGHAVSLDLIHWQHRVPALRPCPIGHPWSGSAVVDHHDTSGLFNGNAGLALIFTYWDVADGRQCQGLAYSRDGYEFETYSGNPVIPQLRCLPGGDDDPDFRDPKVFWHEASARWVMIVAGGIVRLFSSDNLIDWRLENSYPDLRTECPDLFPLILEGRERWVLSGGGQWYLVGNFDGKSFEHTARRQGFTHGRDFYASQTWSDVPDGRRLMTTWLYSWGYKGVQTAPWSGGCLTLPYELSLGGPHEEPRLVMRPAAEVEGLRHERAPLADKLARGSLDIQLGSGAFEVEATVHDNGSAIFAVPGPVGVYRFGYVGDTREMFIDRTKAGHAGIEGFAERFAARVAARDGVVRLRVFVDGCSIELFGNNGEVVITCLALIDTRGPRVKVEGNAVAELAVYGLRSIWR